MNNNINLIKRDNKIVVSSREIAENFEKEHSKVLRAIRNLECSSEFRQANFGESSYYNEQNKQQPEYLITRDGFTLLAMGFTGKKAMQFKEAYIEAFNKMELALKTKNKEVFNVELIETKKKNADARLKNANIKEAKFLLEVADKYRDILSSQSVELITINAIEKINGKNTVERAKLLNSKYYSAGEIGKELGLTGKMIGMIANRNSVKTDEYGIKVLDKSRSSNKQVPTFKYNEKGRERIIELVREGK